MSLGRVLVVDDDKNICELLRLYLEKEGYGVILAHDGEEAVVKFNALKPDIILLDIMLPGIDGWQVCREIRKKSNVPIIMITAKVETFDKVLGLELGADDYIVKPFDTKEVIARIKAVYRRVGQSSGEAEIKEVKYDKLSVNMTRYECLTHRRRSLSFCSTLLQIRTEFIQEISSLMRYGALNITAIRELSTFTLSVCVRSLRAFLTSGHLKLYGA